MRTPRENVCCLEKEDVVAKLEESVAQPPPCITDHPGFVAVCLNPWVLQTAWYQYKQQCENPYDGPLHKKYSHVAYRQFVRWVWQFLGRHVRLVIPSCAVSCIRAHFPPPGPEEEFIFEGFKTPTI